MAKQVLDFQVPLFGRSFMWRFPDADKSFRDTYHEVDIDVSNAGRYS
jgi:hypothetical protein